MTDESNLENLALKLCDMNPDATSENRDLIYFMAKTILLFRNMDEGSSSQRLSMRSL